MAKDTGGDHRGLDTLKVDGGMTSSDVTMQLQADICGIEVERPEMRECVYRFVPLSFAVSFAS